MQGGWGWWHGDAIHGDSNAGWPGFQDTLALRASREQFLGPEHDYVACECCYYKMSTGPEDPGWTPDRYTNWVWNEANAPHRHLLDAATWAWAKRAFENEEELLASGSCAW